MGAEVFHRRLYAATRKGDTCEPHAHLAASEGCQYCQVIAVAQMSDAKHAPLYFSEAHAQRKVEALVDQASQLVRIDARRRDDAGQYARGSAHCIGRPQAWTAARTPAPQR